GSAVGAGERSRSREVPASSDPTEAVGTAAGGACARVAHAGSRPGAEGPGAGARCFSTRGGTPAEGGGAAPLRRHCCRATGRHGGGGEGVPGGSGAGSQIERSPSRAD